MKPSDLIAFAAAGLSGNAGFYLFSQPHHDAATSQQVFTGYCLVALSCILLAWLIAGLREPFDPTP